MSNLTVFMLTGDETSILSAVKNLSANTNAYSAIFETSKPLPVKPSSKKLATIAPSKTYSADTFVFAKHSLPAYQQKVANHFIANKSQVRFMDLKNYILSNNPTTFSNAALSNYLRANNFKRNIQHYPNNTTKIIWVRK